eukprot:5870209-Pyramimonas_sp.AAC.1
MVVGEAAPGQRAPRRERSDQQDEARESRASFTRRRQQPRDRILSWAQCRIGARLFCAEGPRGVPGFARRRRR